MIDEKLYASAVAKAFKAIVSAADQLDPDVLEADSTGDMVTLMVPKTGEKIVINTQRAVHQIWVAGKGEGVHFSLGDDGVWRDDKNRGLELFGWIDTCAHAAASTRLFGT